MRDLQDWHKKVESDARAAQRVLEQMERTAGVISSRLSVDRVTALNAKVQPSENLRRRRTGRLTESAAGKQLPESREELISRLLDPTLTLVETAQMLEVCPATVRRYTNRGILAHERSKGNQRRFKLSAVLEFLGSQGQSMPNGTYDKDK